ncbi:MAG: Tll0287-like domain-containing protein [Chthoniobacterales bacterium]
MPHRLGIVAGLLAATALAADPTPREIGDQVAGRLFANLMTTLQEKIASGGPEAAIAYCRLEAVPLTAQVAEEFPRVKNVRRTALRVRNSANVPDATDRSVLEEWLAAWNPSAPPQPVMKEFTSADGTKELRYYRPVPVMATCLTCHGSGDEIPGNVRAALQRDYPQDEAVDFREGDLRGAIVVTFDAE